MTTPDGRSGSPGSSDDGGGPGDRGGFPVASTRDGISFTLTAALPNLIQGLFRRRPRAVKAAVRLNVDRRAVRTIRRLRRRYGGGPLWIKVARDPVLLLLETADVRRVLEGAPEPFAADPDAKRRGMSHFQPDALTISRGELWRKRRRFNEAVLDTGRAHRLSDRFLAVASEEAERMLDGAERAGGELDADGFQGGFRRLARRIIFGDGAAEDEELSDLLATLMNEANKLPKERSESFDPFMERIERYVSGGEPGSLVSRFGDAPADGETKAAGQVPHWFFAMQDTLATNAFRTLALIATHPRQRSEVERELAEVTGGEIPSSAEQVERLRYLEACLEEAMRLWPTTALLSRETVEKVSWDGEEIPGGMQLLISNTFNHRDPERHEFADRFSPEEWTEGNAGSDWSFNHLSHGPQGCPGAGLAVFVGKAVLATLLGQRRVTLLEPSLDPERPLPHMLDFFRIRFALAPRA